MQDNLENPTKAFKDRFAEKNERHAQNWKKIQALVNFSKTIDDFEEWEALEFIIRYFQKGYLDDHQENFLDYVILKYNVDYDKWCYKTYWVKRKIKETAKASAQQLTFFFPDLEKRKIEARAKMPLFSKLERFKLISQEAM